MADEKPAKAAGSARARNALGDPDRQQPATVLAGYVADSPASGMRRLYLTPQFDQYVEFREDDVLHTDEAGDEGAGPSTVWLRRGSPTQLTRIVSHQVQAEFLQGSITATHMPGAAAATLAGALPPTGYACTRNYVCSINPHIPACQVHTEICGSAFCGPPTGALCPTGAFIC